MGYWEIVTPESLTNLVTNPSIETATTGWADDGTNTIAQSTAQSKYGYNSLLCTWKTGGSTQLASYAITLTAAAHYFAAWVYLGTWTGGAINLDIANFTSATTDTASTTTTTTGSWVKLEMFFTPDAGDLSGNIIVETASSPANNDFIYVDGVCCYAVGYSCTYIDGDMDGAKWAFSPHASQSISDGYAPGLGRIYDINDDLNFIISHTDGTGYAPKKNLLSSLSAQPGALHDGERTDRRIVTLNGSIQGDSVSDFHDKKQTLIKALLSETVKIDQKPKPRTFRVTSPTVDKEVYLSYDGGLQGGAGVEWANENYNISLVGGDPFFYQIGESAATIDANQTRASGELVGRVDGLWKRFGLTGTLSAVHAIVHHEGILYVGGTFQNGDGDASIDFIGQYDTTNDWQPMETGFDAAVYEVIVSPTGTIIAGGYFTNAKTGPVVCRGVAEWDGTNWAAIGPPSAITGNGILSMCYDNSGNLYVAGDFTNLDAIATADYIAMWDGSAWNSITTGGAADGIIRAIAWGPDNKLYAAGEFANIGGSAHERIAVYDGSTWSDLETNGAGSTVRALVFDDAGILYAGGDFADIGSVSSGASAIAKYDGNVWSKLADVGNLANLTQVFSLDIDKHGLLYVGGDGQITSGTGNSILVWNGSRFRQMDQYSGGFDANVVYCDLVNDDIYFGLSTAITTHYRPGLTSVSYAGTAKAYPTIHVERSTSGGTLAEFIRVENNTTGAQLFIDNYQLQLGEKITIGTTPGKQYATSSVFGDIYNVVLPESDWGNFYLMPGNDGNKSNDVEIFVYTTGSPTVTCWITWKDAYISED